ncbi:MAG: hypothetical protein VR67_18765 [Peptococcaceae bacterium BRH_c8a]|nr:MAG: hypothetical protein VR67_18765 [Peptococcaceae bacterium BRH_c8a]
MPYSDGIETIDSLIQEHTGFFDHRLRELVAECAITLANTNSKGLEPFKQSVAVLARTGDRGFALSWLPLTMEITGAPWETLWNWLNYSPTVQGVLTPEAMFSWAQFYISACRYNQNTGNLIIKQSKDIFAGVDETKQLMLLESCLELSLVSWPAAMEFFGAIPMATRYLPGSAIKDWYDEGFHFARRDTRLGEAYFKSGAIWPQCSFEVFGSLITRGKRLLALDIELAIVFFNTVPSLVQKLGARISKRLLPEWSRWIEGLYPVDATVALEYARASGRVLPLIKGKGLASWSGAVLRLAGVSKKAALAFAASGDRIFDELNIEEFQDWFAWVWAEHCGQEDRLAENVALQTRESRKQLVSFRRGIDLDDVVKSLTLYAVAFFNREIIIKSSALLPREVIGRGSGSSTGDGKRVYLPRFISVYPTAGENLSIYKSLLIHEVAHLIGGTYAIEPQMLADTAGEFNLSTEYAEISEYHLYFSLFENYSLILHLFELIEDARVKKLLLMSYPGLERELLSRDSVDEEANGGSLLSNAAGAVAAATLGDGQITDAGTGYFEQTFAVFWQSVVAGEACVADSLHLATRWYLYIGEHSQDIKAIRDFGRLTARSGLSPILLAVSRSVERKCSEMGYGSGKYYGQAVIKALPGELDKEPYIEYLTGLIADFVQEENDSCRAMADYDEWDCNQGGYKPDWVRVREFTLRPSSAAFVRETLEHHYGLVSSLKRYFALLRPDRFMRFRRQEDGDQVDLDAMVEAWVDNKRGVMVTGGFYTRIDKRIRDVAVAFLIDLSNSTDQVLDSGKTILDVEKESVIIMAEALEVLGDKYAIYGFNSEGRDRVNFYVVKEFDEVHGDVTKQRFGGFKSSGQTRLGAAVRHAISKLESIEASVRLLILLSDGRPYDFDYCAEPENTDFKSWLQRDELLYAQEDTRMAISEAKMKLITPFCITVDRKGKEYLEKIMGSVGYIVIDNIELLPVKLPELYKKLTV